MVKPIKLHMGQNSQIGKIAELVNSCQIETLKKIKNTLKNSFSFKKNLPDSRQQVCMCHVCLSDLSWDGGPPKKTSLGCLPD